MPNPTQFRVLYRQFLFRMVDLELLSADARGDMTRLFGQFAALLVFMSLGLAWAGGALARIEMAPASRLAAEWSGVHSLVATTMLVVGLFAILTWESTFPDRRDVLVLSPLPIWSRTIFQARIAAVATALAVTVATLHSLAGVVWPLCLNNAHQAVLAPSTAFDAALPPLEPEALEPVLNHDLRGATMPRNVTVGVLKSGRQRVFAYGSANADTVFQIGSISRTFALLELTQLAAEARVALTQKKLPPDQWGDEFDLLSKDLAKSAGMSYPALLEAAVRQFGMPHTTVDEAGTIRSTAGDILGYLARQGVPKFASPLVWNYDAGTGDYEHYAEASDVFFNLKRGYGVVILTDAKRELYPFSSVLGRHIRQRLAGEPAVAFTSVIVPASGGTLPGLLRLFTMWWAVMLAAGAFIYCCILGSQGVAALLLPRRYFLRVSSYMQMAAFAILVAGYFLEPPYAAWSPSYWFVGLFEQLTRSPALAEHATPAWIAMPAVFGVTLLAYAMAYFRTIRRIVEEPDIASSGGGRNWLPSFGNGFATAIGQFSIRTLLRSRQHRLLMAFYAGVGFAMAILFRKGGDAAGIGLLCSTIVMMALWVVGVRVAFSLPVSMKANWIFQTILSAGGKQRMIARRRAFYALAVVPVCGVTAVLTLAMWPWPMAVKHSLLLALFGSGLAEICLHGTQKLPFTCSYLPGKAGVNIAVLLSVLLILPALVSMAELEHDSFASAAGFSAAVAFMLAFAIAARMSAARLAVSDQGTLQFEELDEPVVIGLNIRG